MHNQFENIEEIRMFTIQMVLGLLLYVPDPLLISTHLPVGSPRHTKGRMRGHLVDDSHWH